MSQKDTITTPQSSAGLVRIYDVSSSNVHIPPHVVVIGAIAFLALIVLLRAFI